MARVRAKFEHTFHWPRKLEDRWQQKTGKKDRKEHQGKDDRARGPRGWLGRKGQKPCSRVSNLGDLPHCKKYPRGPRTARQHPDGTNSGGRSRKRPLRIGLHFRKGASKQWGPIPRSTMKTAGDARVPRRPFWRKEDPPALLGDPLKVAGQENRPSPPPAPKAMRFFEKNNGMGAFTRFSSSWLLFLSSSFPGRKKSGRVPRDSSNLPSLLSWPGHNAANAPELSGNASRKSLEMQIIPYHEGLFGASSGWGKRRPGWDGQLTATSGQRGGQGWGDTTFALVGPDAAETLADHLLAATGSSLSPKDLTARVSFFRVRKTRWTTPVLWCMGSA